MNASPKGNPTQGSSEVEKSGQVINFAAKKFEAELKKGSIKAASNLAAPYILKGREIGFINSRHEELMAMPQELQDEFLDAIARNTVDQAWYNDFLKKVKLLMPGGIIRVPYAEIRDGSWALMLLTGMVGDQRTQEEFAKRAEPGGVEKLVAKVLPWVAKLDFEPDTRAFLEIIIKLIQVKGLTIEALRQLRTAVRSHEMTNAAPQVLDTLRNIEDAANLAQLPVEGDHLTPEEMAKEAALGPEAQKDAA